jgi:beta-lactamase class A
MNKKIILFVFFSIVAGHAIAQKQTLRNTLVELAGKVDGQVGIAVMDLSTGDTLVYNPNIAFAMQSVYKFPLALAVLKKVDEGKLSLGQKIRLTKRDLLPGTWSPLTKKYPEANVEVTLQEVLMYTVTHSDNNGCDILFRLLGGPASVQEYVRQLGVKEITIVTTEEEMGKGWDVQFTNWCKPHAMLQLLQMFYDKKLLSASSQQLLWKMMAETSRGANRIKGLLPQDTEVLHRPGTGGTTNEGVTGAVNDVGIVTLPNGKHAAIVVYMNRVKGELKDLEKVIAEIARASYDSDWLAK